MNGGLEGGERGAINIFSHTCSYGDLLWRKSTLLTPRGEAFMNPVGADANSNKHTGSGGVGGEICSQAMMHGYVHIHLKERERERDELVIAWLDGR